MPVGYNNNYSSNALNERSAVIHTLR